MDPNDKQLKEQLARGPFARDGFDNRLRRRIEERLDERRLHTRRFWRSSWRLPTAVLGSVLLVILGFGLWHAADGNGTTVKDAAKLSASPPAAADTAAHIQPSKHYGVLIGLRKDISKQGDQAGPVSKVFPISTYRTVLVAPVQDRLQLIADTPQLYMPYKQSFWQITVEDSGNGRQTLRAIQVTNRKSNKRAVEKMPAAAQFSERVLYAGNEYLSIGSTVRDTSGALAPYQWVKRIDQLNAATGNPRTEPHVRLADIVTDAAAGLPSDQWSIVREPGRWAAELSASPSDNRAGAPAPILLPVDVVKNDTLTMPWQDILKMEPAARDAFTYGNLLGVVTDRDIRIRQKNNAAALPAALTFPIDQNEAIVMIQYVEDPYVVRWIKDMRMLSGK